MLYEPKVKIILHGYFKDLYPDDITMSGTCVAEIVNGMCKMTKAFNPKLGEEKHRMKIIGFDTKDALYSDLTPATKEIHIIPDMVGGKGGLFQIVLGAVIIAVAIWTGGAGLALFEGFTISSGSLLLTGVSLVLGGLLQVLSPAPKLGGTGGTAASDPAASQYLGATQNTVKIGTRIPIPYGIVQIYGQYLSFDVQAKDVAV